MQTVQDIAARVERERHAHTEKDVMAEHNKIKNRFSHVDQYPSRRRLEGVYKSLMSNVEGLQILDYGCGRGDMTREYLRKGAAKVCAIDISPVYVADGEASARREGFAEERFDFQVMDAHKMTFPDNSFDIVAGWSILHHLDADTAMNEIHRVLKPGGRVLLWEPLLDHPLLKLFRLLTPQARTEDELPFSGAAIRRILSHRQWRSELGYCGFLEAPVAMFTSVVMRNRPDNFLIRLADRAEQWSHQNGVLLNWNQHVLFNMVKAD
ncbi:MAG: Methyltransferase type 11 [Verrucomicrobiaceae bacterium]|nr:Methyltransferase type 11 [Verrucomicrobiaceae bacterium]